MIGEKLLELLTSYWYLALIVLFFSIPILSRIQDFISGKPKRESAQKKLDEKEAALNLQQQKLLYQRSELSDGFSRLAADKQHLNDLLRGRTVDMARNVASREYLRKTPAFSALKYDGTSEIPRDAYYRRLCSVLNTSMQISSPFDISAKIVSSSGISYHTTLYSCDCPDFQYRGEPCKHMIRLALESGLLLNFDTMSIETEISHLMDKRALLLHEADQAQQHLNALSQKEKDFANLMDETKQSYPWLAAHYADFLSIYDEEIFQNLLIKARNYRKAKDMKSAVQKELRFWQSRAKQYEYQLNFYETLFPWLEEFKEVPPIEAYQYTQGNDDTPQEDSELFKIHLSPEEKQTLTLSEKYQLVLDRYIGKKGKSPWEVGIEYERYIGYLCEMQGFSVQYNGALTRKEDMGRDLILTKDSLVVLIQCKRWAKEKAIHENHVFQLAGSTYEYQYNHPEKKVVGVLVTSTDFSPIATHCAELLGLRLFPRTPFKEYPRIKCNIGRDSSGQETKIFHLPMDQQYDRVHISEPGECYCWTVAEAEEKGFRRAHRWSGNNPK